jgi:hypothetical protein
LTRQVTKQAGCACVNACASECRQQYKYPKTLFACLSSGWIHYKSRYWA